MHLSSTKKSSNLVFSICMIYAHIDLKQSLCAVQLIQQMRRGQLTTTRNGFGSFHWSWCLSRAQLLAFFSSLADEKVSLSFYIEHYCSRVYFSFCDIQFIKGRIRVLWIMFLQKITVHSYLRYILECVEQKIIMMSCEIIHQNI